MLNTLILNNKNDIIFQYAIYFYHIFITIYSYASACIGLRVTWYGKIIRKDKVHLYC